MWCPCIMYSENGPWIDIEVTILAWASVAPDHDLTFRGLWKYSSFDFIAIEINKISQKRWLTCESPTRNWKWHLNFLQAWHGMGLNPQFLWTTLIAYLALISGPTRAMFGMSWHAKRNDGKPTACQGSVLLQVHYEAGDGMDGNKFCLVCSVAKHFPQFKIIRPHSKFCGSHLKYVQVEHTLPWTSWLDHKNWGEFCFFNPWFISQLGHLRRQFSVLQWFRFG